MNYLQKLQTVKIQRFRSLSALGYGKYCDKNYPKTCTACNQLHDVQIRHQSTITHPNLKNARNKRKRKQSKYAELLCVGENSAVQRRASVQKLTCNDLRLLANTNYSLNELYKLKPFMERSTCIQHTYNNLTVIDNFNLPLPDPVSKPLDLNAVDMSINTTIPSSLLGEEKLEDNVEVEEEELAYGGSEKETVDLLDSLSGPNRPNAFNPELAEEEVAESYDVEVAEDLAVDHTKALEEEARKISESTSTKAEYMSNSLAAYIELCANLKVPQKGLNAFYFCKWRMKCNAKGPVPITNINVYNALLKGFATRGHYSKINEVLRIMKADSIQLNVQSYMAIFECLGRIGDRSNCSRLVANFVREANDHGITFDKIMNEGVFLNDQREKVLNAMRNYDPKYVPKYKTPVLHYSNNLLVELNCIEQLTPPENVKSVKGGLFSPQTIKNGIKRQFEVERSGYVTVKSIESDQEVTEDTLKYRQLLSDHIKMWEEAALQAYNRDLQTLSAKRHAMNNDVYMRCIPAKDFVNIIIEEAKKIAQGSETYSPTVNLLYRDLGAKVYNRYRLLQKQKTGVLEKTLKIHSKYCNHYTSTHGKLNVVPDTESVDCFNPRQYWQWSEYEFKHEGSTLLMDHQEWNATMWQSVGKFLYNIIMHDLKIDVNVMRLNSKHKNYLPAFYTLFRNQARLMKEEVKPHPVLSRLWRASKPETLTFPSCEVPMHCPPVPWISVQTGSYLFTPTDMIRLPPHAVVQKQRVVSASPLHLYPSFDALNQLAAVPWKVNKQVLDVIMKVFRSGGSSKLDVPEPPSSLTPPPPVNLEAEKSEKFQAFRQKLQYKRKKAEMYSLWCDCLYRLSLANHFRDEVFWLPHNMDFRGRVYPVPPHLNHLGSDLARSMLIFAQPRPLGPRGLDWLKLHLVNLTGLKKRDPVSERLAFANEMLDEIFDSADNPLEGRRWWAESEEPWQTLACCMEITNAIRSGDPETYESCFPVHQDGSCNGLQHYAALGRDSAGAYSVNLAPCDYPQDVYSAVVKLVEEQRKVDEENGVKVAAILNGFVKRKVIKQTVMTTVYGVTRYGARLQIARQLKDISDFPKDFIWAASSYLTGRTFESLRSMFTSTREIQDWFTECARLISSVGGQNVEWVTPLGLPVVQPYSRFKKIVFKGQEKYNINKIEKPNVMKQKNAFPPNFIHSLDSSHMMLTSLYCEKAGITFVSVHDCYWTHPSTVHIMNKICREQFVALHSEPILEDLSVFLSQRYSYNDNEYMEDGAVIDLTKHRLNKVLRQLPKTGDFDIKKVLDSVYFFS